MIIDYLDVADYNSLESTFMAILRMIPDTVDIADAERAFHNAADRFFEERYVRQRKKKENINAN